METLYFLRNADVNSNGRYNYETFDDDLLEN